VTKPRHQFADLLDSAARQVVFALNAYDSAPSLKAIDAIRKSLEEHALAFCALGAAFPRVFSPGPTLEQLEDLADDGSKRDTSPGFRTRRPPAPPPIGDGGPPPLPPRR
jgi:hypothetical protein